MFLHYFYFAYFSWAVGQHFVYCTDTSTTISAGAVTNALQIIVVFDSRHPVYGQYGRLALDFIRDKTQLLLPFSSNESVILDAIIVEVPRNDSDSTFEKVCNTYSSGFTTKNHADLIVDLTVTPLVSATVKSFAKAVNCPSASLMCCTKSEHIQDLFTNDDFQQHLVFNPPSKVWIRVIRDFVESEKMATAAIILDNSFEIERSHRMLLAQLPCKHLMIRLNFDDETAIRNFTSKMHQNGMQNFFIVARLENAGKVLEEAYNLDMLVSGQRPNWFVLTKESGNVECTQCSDGTIVKLKPAISNLALRDEILSYIKQKSSPDRDNLLTRQEDYNEIDMLYVFDVTSALIKALLATREPMTSPVRQKPTRTVSCDTVYQDNIPLKSSPRNIRAVVEDTVSTNLAWYFYTVNLTGALGPIIPGDERNNTIIDAKLNIEEQIGTWTHTEGLRNPQGIRLPRSVTNTRLRVAILVETPFIIRADPSDNSSKPYTGYLIDLMQKISDELKLEYELYEVPDQQYGAVDDNGEWNGLIRELKDKKADIGLAPLSVMAERENVVDFTVPYFDLVGITILMKKTNQEPSLFKFVTVLEAPVWGSIFGAYLLTSLLMFIFDRWSPYSYRNIVKKELKKKQQESVDPLSGVDNSAKIIETKEFKDKEPPQEVPFDARDEYGTRVFTLKESLWFCMTSLTPQGGGEAPRNLSGRLVAATWWMFGFIIIASYTANLAAFLTVSRLETQIESLDDLAKQYGIRYAPLENSATETYFKRMWKIEEKFYEIWRDMSLNESMSEKERAELAVWDYPVSDKYTKLWLTMKDFPRPKTIQEGVEWVKATNITSSGDKEGFALIGDAAILQYKANLDCDLTIVGEEFSRKPYALAVQEGSVLRDQLSGVILKLLNQRELELMKEEWWQTRMQKTCTNTDDENEGISIQNIGGVFILVLAGTVLACIMLAFEYYWYKRRSGEKATELVKAGTANHSTNFQANFNTDYNTRFHNIFVDQKKEDLAREKEKQTEGVEKDNVNRDRESDREHKI